MEVGYRSRAADGEVISGDLHYINHSDSGALIAVIDGAGHGLEAAEAARLVVPTLARFSQGPLAEIFKESHKALKGSRGAVMSAAYFDFGTATMTWTGLGNVEGILFRGDSNKTPPRETLLLRNGVIGFESYSPRIAALQVYSGDTLIFATDGISPGCFAEIKHDKPVQEVADAIICDGTKGYDDALVVVVRLMERSL